MPSTYAHYRFGEQVRQLINEEKASVISRYPQLYRIGLHGPDILFYYNALISNPVNQAGFALHEVSGTEFFAHFTEVITNHTDDDRYLAYLYGVLTHFALDATCHGYVEERVSVCGISHTETEMEFDRFLMIKDHKDPEHQLNTMHIAPTKENAKVIASFYEGIEEKSIQKALRDMILCHKVLLPTNPGKRSILYGLLYASGKYDSLKDQVMAAKANPACEDSNEKLYELYHTAKKRAVELINYYDAYDAYPEIYQSFLRYNFSGIKVEE